MAVMTGTIATSALGWTGTQGTLTARECYEEENSKGSTYTECVGRFIAEDLTIVDSQAVIRWDDGAVGEQRQIQTLALGGYTGRDTGNVAITLVLSTSFTVAALGCSLPALSTRVKLWVIRHLPPRVQAWYEREWSPRAA